MTSLDIDEECPNWGASLAETLTITTTKKKQKQQQQHNSIIEPKQSSALSTVPKIQTAYDLLRLKSDIPRIESFIPLPTSGLFCIVGSYKEATNLLLTRLSVRALLSSKYGGLDSAYAIIIDAGNRSDVYQPVSFARQYGMDFRKVANRIIVTRTFTIHQLKSIISSGELTKIVQKHQASVVAVPGLLDLCDDPNIKQKEAKRVIGRIMKSLDTTSSKLLVIMSVQENNKYYRELFTFTTRATIKQIRLNNAKYERRLTAEMYNNQGNRKKNSISFTEKELKIVQKR